MYEFKAYSEMNPLGGESSLIQKLRVKVEGKKERKKERKKKPKKLHRKDHSRLGQF